MSGAEQIPERMTIFNLKTGFGISAQFNPEELNEKMAAVYNRLAVLGLSHQPMQYQYTENLKVAFDLGFDAMSERDIITQGGGAMHSAFAHTVTPVMQGIQGARRFMMSLLLPSRGAQDVSGGAPPRCQFIWPQLYSITCRVTSLTGTHKRFAMKGLPTSFVLKVELEEVRDVRLYSEDVFDMGTVRAAGSVQG